MYLKRFHILVESRALQCLAVRKERENEQPS